MFIFLIIFHSILFFCNTARTASIPVHSRALPIGITPSDALDILESLQVSPQDETIPYKRQLFPTWDKTAFGACNVREYVLERDGTDVLTNKNCYPYQGVWISPYDLEQITASQMVDIDHLVPLKEAWVSGANLWDADKREWFANDITLPELVAVSRHSNREKGDKDPAEWLPDNSQFHCDYVLAWIQVKQAYNLTVDEAEKNALLGVLNAC